MSTHKPSTWWLHLSRLRVEPEAVHLLLHVSAHSSDTVL